MLPLYLSMIPAEKHDRFEYLYKKYVPLLLKIAHKMVKSDRIAEDAVHDAFLSILQHNDSILSRSDKDFRQYIVKTVQRKCIDHIRKNNTINQHTVQGGDESDLVSQIPSNADPIDEVLVGREDFERLRGVLQQLEEDDCRMFEMMYLDEFSQKEIATAFGLSVSQVSGRIYRTKLKLRKLLKKE